MIEAKERRENRRRNKKVRRKRANKRKKEKEKTKEKIMKVKKVAEEWKIWNEKEEATNVRVTGWKGKVL